MNSHIIVITLDRTPERKKIIEQRFKGLSIDNYTFFPAFDGKNIINMSYVVPIIKGVGIGRKLSLSEISIINSHLSALKHAQIMQYENVIILEDDVFICEDWYARLKILESLLPNSWEYIYLAGHSDYISIPKYDVPTLIKAPKMVGAFSYLVNKGGIEKLIKYCGEFVTTYDDMITHKIESNKLEAYLYLPYMTYHLEGESLNWGSYSGKHSSFNYFKNKL